MGARPGPCVIETKAESQPEMRFMRHTAGKTKWDHKRNEDILHELYIEPVLDIKTIGFNMYTACPEQDFLGQF